MAGQRVLVGGERGVHRHPVLCCEAAARGGQDVFFLDPHMVQVKADVALHRLLEGGAARLTHHLEGQQFMFEIADGALAGGVVAIEPVQRRGELGATLAHDREQQFGFLAVVELLGELVHIEQHRTQHAEVGHLLFAPRLGQQHRQGTQHGRQSLMLVVDDIQGRVSHGRQDGSAAQAALDPCQAAAAAPRGRRCCSTCAGAKAACSEAISAWALALLSAPRLQT